MASLYEDLLKSQKVAVSKGVTGQAVETIPGYDTSPASIKRLAIAAEKAGFSLNRPAIEKCGKSKMGGPAVLFAVKRDEPTKASVTLHASGSLVLAGVDAKLVLKFPTAPKAPKPPATPPTP